MQQNEILRILGQELYDECLYCFKRTFENEDYTAWHELYEICKDESNEIKDALTKFRDLLWQNQSFNQIF